MIQIIYTKQINAWIIRSVNYSIIMCAHTLPQTFPSTFPNTFPNTFPDPGANQEEVFGNVFGKVFVKVFVKVCVHVSEALITVNHRLIIIRKGELI